jgi:hypothetical protein
MTNTIKSLCGNGKKNCTSYLKTEYALKRNLTYIYLNNGDKIINGCSHYSLTDMQNMVEKLAVPSLEAINFNQPPKLNFSNSLNLANFTSIVNKA